jgi:hypothetical protein
MIKLINILKHWKNNIWKKLNNELKNMRGLGILCIPIAWVFVLLAMVILVLDSDNFVEGVAYDKETLEEVFDNDFKIAVDSARELLRDIEYNHIVFGVIVEMCFQLGKPRVMKFKKMWEALREKNLDKASQEMIDSNWHKQTTKRCEALASIMKNANK